MKLLEHWHQLWHWPLTEIGLRLRLLGRSRLHLLLKDVHNIASGGLMLAATAPLFMFTLMMLLVVSALLVQAIYRCECRTARRRRR